LRLINASAEALPLPDRSVDRIASVSSLYFWPDLEAAFHEMARVTRPGGRLAIAWEPPEELSKWPGHVHGFRLVSEEDLRALLAQSGFAPLRCVEGRGRKPDRFLCLTAQRRPG
jgi:ubiquinone/menaquinone biosynthesis C-methylase UbiE